MTRNNVMVSLAVLLMALPVSATTFVLDDFDGGVTHVNHPAPGTSGVWYDAADNTFGSAGGGTLDGSPALQVTDGGFTNGVYAIYSGAIPANGTYRVEMEMLIDESAGANDAIRAYEVGAIVNGTHRGPNPSAIAGASNVGSYSGLTSGDDTGLGTQTVSTNQFSANAGDDILISLSTDVTSGGFNLDSGGWSGAFALIDNLRLISETPITEFIVESREGGKNYANYSESGGGFADSSAKSSAAGTTAGIGSRFGSMAFAKEASYSFTPSVSGPYQAFATWAPSTNATSSLEHVVTHDGGSTSVLLDQNSGTNPTGGDNWNSLGTYDFTAGNTYSVSQVTDGTGSGIMRNDAIRWVLIPEPASAMLFLGILGGLFLRRSRA